MTVIPNFCHQITNFSSSSPAAKQVANPINWSTDSSPTMQNNQQTSQSWWRRPWFRRRASEHEQLVDEDQQQSLWDRVKSHSVILKQFLPYLWPKGRWDLRVRVVFSLLMLVIAKLVGVGAPYFYKIAVDQLSPKDGIILTIPYLAISLYGAGRLFSSISDNLKDSFFVAVRCDWLIFIFLHLKGYTKCITNCIC